MAAETDGRLAVCRTYQSTKKAPAGGLRDHPGLGLERPTAKGELSSENGDGSAGYCVRDRGLKKLGAAQ